VRVFGSARPFDGGGGGGGGTVTSVNDVLPDGTGNVALFGADIPIGPQVTTAVSATTAALGAAQVYIATAPITITISSADIVEGRELILAARSASIGTGTPAFVATEGAETIDGVSTPVPLLADYASITLRVRGGNLESI
jgi:hypothetical protein